MNFIIYNKFIRFCPLSEESLEKIKESMLEYNSAENK